MEYRTLPVFTSKLHLLSVGRILVLLFKFVLVLTRQLSNNSRVSQDKNTPHSNPAFGDSRVDERLTTLKRLESLDDVSDLVQLSNDAVNTTDSCWKVDDAMRIVRPLLGLDPQYWPSDLQRVRLLESLEVPESAGPSQAALKKFMSGPLAEYEAKWRYPDDGCLNRAHITLSLNDDIYELIKPMAEKEIDLWTAEEVEAAATLLGGGPSIDALGATPEADRAWWRFCDKWDDFLLVNPAIKRRVDPFVVFINVMGAPPPARLETLIEEFPADGTDEAPAAVNGCPFVRAFTTLHAATHFVGWLQGRYPGLRVWVTRGNAMPAYY